MIKVITKLGLIMMEPEVRREKLSSLMDGNRIDAHAVADLINAARDACYILTNKESEAVDENQKIKIRWMLSRIDGEEIIRGMDPDELAEWVVDLRENGTAFSSSELGDCGYGTDEDGVDHLPLSILHIVVVERVERAALEAIKVEPHSSY